MAQISCYKSVFTLRRADGVVCGGPYTAILGISGGPGGPQTHATRLLLETAATNNLTAIVEAQNKGAGANLGRTGAPQGAVSVDHFQPVLDVWT